MAEMVVYTLCDLATGELTRAIVAPAGQRPLPRIDEAIASEQLLWVVVGVPVLVERVKLWPKVRHRLAGWWEVWRILISGE